MKKGVIFMVATFVWLGTILGQVSKVSQAQSLYIYNFSRLIKWPEKSRAGDFVIGVVDDEELFKDLSSYVSNKKVGSQSIVVKNFEDPLSVSRCHIVFIGNSKINRFNEILSRLEGANCLIVTEKKGMVNSGSAIDLFMEQDKLKYVLNPVNAEKYNLVVSQSLSDYAYKN